MSCALQWQPIETMPRDGREVIVYRPLAHTTLDPHIVIAKTTARPTKSKQGVVHYTDKYAHPTHWMPLPPPPQEGE